MRSCNSNKLERLKRKTVTLTKTITKQTSQRIPIIVQSSLALTDSVKEVFALDPVHVLTFIEGNLLYVQTRLSQRH